MDEIIKKENTTVAVIANEMARAKLEWKPVNVFVFRIFYDIISQIKKDDKDFKDYETKINKLKIDGSIIGSEFNKIKKAADNLLDAKLKIENNRMFKGYTLFSSVEYVKGQAHIKSRLNPDLKLFLLNLKTEFTMVQMGEFLQLSSKYSQLLFICLKSWAGFQQKEIIPKDLYDFLQVPKSCETNFGEFKRRILVPAIKEINKKTSLKISYTANNQQGKKVEKINFIFKEQLDLPFGGADTTKASNCYHENRKKYENDKNHKCKYKASSAECQACVELKPEPAWIKRGQIEK